MKKTDVNLQFLDLYFRGTEAAINDFDKVGAFVPISDRMALQAWRDLMDTLFPKKATPKKSPTKRRPIGKKRPVSKRF